MSVYHSHHSEATHAQRLQCSSCLSMAYLLLLGVIIYGTTLEPLGSLKLVLSYLTSSGRCVAYWWLNSMICMILEAVSGNLLSLRSSQHQGSAALRGYAVTCSIFVLTRHYHAEGGSSMRVSSNRTGTSRINQYFTCLTRHISRKLEAGSSAHTLIWAALHIKGPSLWPHD